MQYLALYIVLFVFVMLSFLRGKHVLFNIILAAYPASVIYKAIVEYGGSSMIDTLNVSGSTYTVHLVVFLLVLLPVYVSMHRIVTEFRLRHSLKGATESLILSVGIVLLTIGISFHVLPDTDIFNLAGKTERFFQSDLGYLLCMIVPVIAVFLLSKRHHDILLPKH